MIQEGKKQTKPLLGPKNFNENKQSHPALHHHVDLYIRTVQYMHVSYAAVCQDKKSTRTQPLK